MGQYLYIHVRNLREREVNDLPGDRMSKTSVTALLGHKSLSESEAQNVYNVSKVESNIRLRSWMPCTITIGLCLKIYR